MKLKLNKKKLKNLSKDSNEIPADMTHLIGGARYTTACDEPDLPTASPNCEPRL